MPSIRQSPCGSNSSFEARRQDVAHNWRDPAFAEAWDARHLAGNPARAAHLSLLLAILKQVNGGWIIDLGCGSGLVAQMVLDQKATGRAFGLDSSAAMLSPSQQTASCATATGPSWRRTP